MASGDAEVDWVYNRLKEDGVFASLEWVSQCVEFIRKAFKQTKLLVIFFWADLLFMFDTCL